MFKVILAYCLLNLVNTQYITSNVTHTTPRGKTYYFKYIPETNEYKIYNRINASAVKPENPKIYSSPKIVKQNLEVKVEDLVHLKAFLDDEWSTKVKFNKSELPVNIRRIIYKSFSNEINSPAHNLTYEHTTRILFDANTKNNTVILKFDTANINETVISAELHFYWILQNSSGLHKDPAVLRLYLIKDQNSNLNESDLTKNPDIHDLLNVIYVAKAQTGWQTFKIKTILGNNITTNKQDLQFLISISQPNQMNFTTLFNDTSNGEMFRTFLVLKTENKEKIILNTENKALKGMPSNRPGCRRRELYINFKRLHWNNFIVEPEGFMAYDCIGRCTKYDEIVTSNHFKLLSTFENVDARRIACCVPTEYSSLPIMFFDKKGNVIIKTYGEVIVNKCGCR